MFRNDIGKSILKKQVRIWVSWRRGTRMSDFQFTEEAQWTKMSPIAVAVKTNELGNQKINSRQQSGNQGHDEKPMNPVQFNIAIPSSL